MPVLTRRRSPDASDECWLVYFGDVRGGTIAIRTGMPPGEDPWSWACGFYPGSHPNECTDGTAATFDEACADFEVEWQVFLSNRTEADFQAWRDERDWTARKYAMWARGERTPSQKPSSLMTCPCGEVFNSHVSRRPKFMCRISAPLKHDGRLVAEIRRTNSTAKGSPISNAQDAGTYITKLPNAEHEAAEWQAAIEALILIATSGGPTMFARIGIMRALNRGHVRGFNPDR